MSRHKMYEDSLKTKKANKKELLDKIFIETSKLNYENHFNLFNDCLVVSIILEEMNDNFRINAFDRPNEFDFNECVKNIDLLFSIICIKYFSNIQLLKIHHQELSKNYNLSYWDIISFIFDINLYIIREKIKINNIDINSFECENKDYILDKICLAGLEDDEISLCTIIKDKSLNDFREFNYNKYCTTSLNKDIDEILKKIIDNA